MTATKLQFKYGSWQSDKAKQMSIDNLGMVVFNDNDQTIYVCGTPFGMSDEKVAELFNRVTTLEQFRQAIYVEGYAQAEYAKDATYLTIFGIQQGKENSDKNDGKIAHDSSNDIVIHFAAEYDDENNKIALQSNLTELKSEILGAIDPQELEKTLDTIKEIQDAIINGSYKITNPNGEVIRTTKVITKDTSTEPETIISVEYTNGESREKKIVYATGDTTDPDNLEKVTYTTGYSNLTKVPSIDGLVAKIDENRKNIENLESKDYVAELQVNENKDNNFVTASSEHKIDELDAKSQSIKIGINYGTFKTGHDNVMDETSTAFTDGIATVKGVQEYIEERLTWVSFDKDS